MPVALPHDTIGYISRATDPKKAIVEKVGDLSDLDVMFNMVLLGTFIRSEKTKGGIIRPDVNVTEDVWQGKVGLVLKLGPNAFVDDAESSFYGQKADVGEWVVFKVGDAWSLNVNGVACRLVRDSSIKLKVKDPNIIF